MFADAIVRGEGAKPRQSQSRPFNKQKQAADTKSTAHIFVFALAVIVVTLHPLQAE
jgi:hypothetical protein